MNRTHMVAFMLLVSNPLRAEPARFLTLKDFVEDWRISKQLTIVVAQKMPADDYSFKASPQERSFGEQMVHIGAALFERFSQISGIASVKKPVRAIITKEYAARDCQQPGATASAYFRTRRRGTQVRGEAR